MPPRRSDAGARSTQQPNLFRLVIEEFRQSGLARTVRQDLRDLERFYLNEEERARLQEMSRLRRFVRRALWLGKSLLLRLTPARRVLMVIALFLAMLNPDFRLGGTTLRLTTWPWAIVVLLIVIMLELKDKLLARDEIEVARKVQLSLLPQSHPHLTGWSIWSHSRPANDVGGDLVDYVESGPGRLGIVLGDVAGKGMGAALLGAKLQAALRALAPGDGRLDWLGRRVNALFYKGGPDNRYATLFYLETSEGSGGVSYLNAGHNPALLVRDGDVTRLTASSFPLGMFPEAEYRQGEIEMAPSDVLLLYSDGLTEARNAGDEEYGESRLTKTLLENRGLDAEALGRRILDEVERFLEDERPQDDLSIVVLKREP